MVGPSRAGRFAGRLFAVVRDDVAGFLESLRWQPAARAGLYTYHTRPAGGSRRIHLRLDAEGSGLLMVDATDVVHLNPTAATAAKLALDGLPQRQIVARMGRGWSVGQRRRLAEDVAKVCQLVEHAATTTDACPTCGLEAVVRQPLFSVPVRAPYKADLALSYGCNNACRHCYNPAGRAGMPSLGLSQWHEVVRKLARVGVPHVIFTGGEPTLFAGLTELIAAAESLGLVTGVNTNGRRLSDRGFAESLSGAGLSHVQITIESHRAEVHNAMSGAASFHETVQGVRNALDAGLHTITNTTLTRRNAADPEALVDFLYGLGLRTFAVNGMIHSGGGTNTDDELDERALVPLLMRLRQLAAERRMRMLWYTPTCYRRLSPMQLGLGARRCNAGQYSMCIEPNGDVLPCQSFYEPVGNFLTDSWDTIWNSELFRSFRDRTEEPERCGLPRKCWDCSELEVCGGGCRLEWAARVNVSSE